MDKAAETPFLPRSAQWLFMIGCDQAAFTQAQEAGPSELPLSYFRHEPLAVNQWYAYLQTQSFQFSIHKDYFNMLNYIVSWALMLNCKNTVND